MVDPTVTITATCACQSFTLSVDFPTSSLPLDRALCLCRTCRQLSGSCAVSYISIPREIDLSGFDVTPYATSEEVTRYFCNKCGAHCLARRKSTGAWLLATGLWDRTEGIINWTGCKFVEDTLDGGLSVWLNDIVDKDGRQRKLKRWLLQDGQREEVQPGHLLGTSPPELDVRGQDRLDASCICGGVKFHITRPNESSKTARSPFSDLIIPFHTGVSNANPDNETWWLRSDNTKYLAGTCACKSCRLASGFEIQPWAFVPKSNIIQENGTEMTYEMGSLKRYVSSNDVWREFCSVCGATVFWHCKERPGIVDVSVGLLDPNEGARVEAWLDW